MESRQHMRKKEYDVIAEIGQAVALPENKKYTIKLVVGGKSFQTSEPKTHRKNYNRFNERFD